MVVRASGHYAQPLCGERPRQSLSVADHLGRVLLEGRLAGLPERNRLGRDDMFEGATLQVGEDGFVDRGAELLPGDDATTARTTQRLVGGERHDVSNADGVGMDPAGDQAGHVGSVEDEKGANGVSDLADRL